MKSSISYHTLFSPENSWLLGTGDTRRLVPLSLFRTDKSAQMPLLYPRHVLLVVSHFLLVTSAPEKGQPSPSPCLWLWQVTKAASKRWNSSYENVRCHPRRMEWWPTLCPCVWHQAWHGGGLDVLGVSCCSHQVSIKQWHIWNYLENIPLCFEKHAGTVTRKMFLSCNFYTQLHTYL